MHRRWFSVYHHGQPLVPPVAADNLPRRVHIAGHVATRHNRDGAPTEVYILAAAADQAQQLFAEARARLLAQ